MVQAHKALTLSYFSPKYKILDVYYQKYLPAADEVLTHGQMGGALFGASLLYYSHNLEHRHKPWQESFYIESVLGSSKSKFYKHFLQSEKNKQKVIEVVQQQIIRSPVEIKSIDDFYWWLSFSIRWQSVGLRVCGFVPFLSGQTYRNIRAFFNSSSFQIWSLYNRDNMKIEKASEYKWLMKEFIFDYTKDADYRDNKLNEPSGDWKKSLDETVNTNVKMRAYLRHPGMRAVVDSEFNNYSNEYLSTNPEIFDEILTPEFLQVLKTREAPNDHWIEV